mgnify:CR=1 FL=1
MAFSDLKLTKENWKVAVDIDNLRSFYDRVTLEKYFEPKQVFTIEKLKKTDKMTTLISDPDDINSWIKGVSYSCIVKTRYIEESILALFRIKDYFSAAILIRQHMELCGLLCLTLQVFKTALDTGEYNELFRFISKTTMGSSYFNNPNLRDGALAFFRTETPTITAMIKAMDHFLEKNYDIDEEKKNFHVHNYAFLCQFSHPGFDSSTFFVNAEKVEEGTAFEFKWSPRFGPKALTTLLRVLKQNLQFGLANYFILSSFDVNSNFDITQKYENIEISYEILSYGMGSNYQ